MLLVRWSIALLLAAVPAYLVGHAPLPRRWRDAPAGAAIVRFRSNAVARVALQLLILVVVVTVLASWLAPYDPAAQPDIVALAGRPPSLAHPFGTDSYSRDLLSRCLYGARVSLSVAALATLLSVTVGTVYGAIAGFYGGRLDDAMMRGIDVALSIPRILLLIAVVALWGQIRLPFLIALIGFTGWFGTSRIVRAAVLALRERELVTAARALGASDRRILWRHVAPNVASPVIVSATLGLGSVIVLEAGLSYLGLGVPEPLASWGSIIRDGRDQVASLWWIALFPGLAIMVTVMAFNIVGDALRDALDPEQVLR
ncbi:MAG TPA: ABC transporter permease [Gemmatimonadaceae bacterium]|nr:ABC transporter permease [Gemmatimonadaceae bacterium]